MEWERTVMEAVPRLENGPVQVWWGRLDDLQPWHMQLLNREEQDRANAYRFPEDRARFVIGCAISRLILSLHLRVAPGQVPLSRSCPKCGRPHGRPVLPDGMPKLSVSHSGDRVAVAFSAAGDIGLDVEEIKAFADFMNTARGILSEEEYSCLRELPCEEQLAGLYTFWTRKEAYLKATGEGLSVPLPSVTSHLIERSSTVYTLHPGPGYVGTLSVLGREPVPVREWDAAILLRNEHKSLIMQHGPLL